jgi:DNA topoisomerase I
MNLLIVESPSKIKTIQKYLTSISQQLGLGDFVIVASYGHFRDLDKKTLSINTNTFEPTYVTMPDKQKIVKEMVLKANKATCVWLASDLDREGEAIAWHVKSVLGLKESQYKRITFNEITKTALQNAIMHPRKIDMNMVDAQKGRRLVDRIVGYKLTDLLWKVFKSSSLLSAGRVQSALLHIILEKEKAICSFIPESYWHVHGDFALQFAGTTGASSMDMLDAKLYTLDDNKVVKFSSEGKINAFMARVIPDGYKLHHVALTKATTRPDKPYITSTLQQDAYTKCGLGIQRTMKIAQDLYEAGLITYMRTDSYHLSDDFMAHLGAFIRDTYGDSYFHPHASSKKAKNSQEAHEAIRPTHLGDYPLTKMTKEHQKLYAMIWRRTVASQMASAEYEELHIDLVCTFATKYFFRGRWRQLVFDGFLKVYADESPETTRSSRRLDLAGLLKQLDVGNKKNLTAIARRIQALNTWTVPPSRFNDSSLVKKMEADGIGRPSTYGTILKKLFDKNYVEKRDIEGGLRQYTHYEWSATKGRVKEIKEEKHWFNERNVVIPTAIGQQVDAFLSQAFPLMVNVDFTAALEADLDRIASGDTPYLASMKTFYKMFMESLSQVTLPGRGNKTTLQQATVEPITVNGIEYIVRGARYGPVIEYKDSANKNKSSYINLSPYLKATKKGMEDITEDDIRFMTALPIALTRDIYIKYGSYGFYITDGTKNKTIYPNMLEDIRNKKYDKVMTYFQTAAATTSGAVGSSYRRSKRSQ